MKKALFLLLIIGVFIGCRSSIQEPIPDYVLGIYDEPTIKSYDKDSLHFVTPDMEISSVIDFVFRPDYENRETVRSYVIGLLESELEKPYQYELKLMSKDYLSINKVLEQKIYAKYCHPEWKVSAPEEILITDQKYTLFISMTAYHTDLERGTLYFCVINNEEKTIERIDRHTFKASPLKEKVMEKMILKGISKLTEA